MATAEKKRGIFSGIFRRNKHGKTTVLTNEAHDVHKTTAVNEPVQSSTFPRPTHTHEVIRNGSISVPLTTSSAVVATESEPQPRKKRAAPRPPSAVVATVAAQSPTSSASSGFEDSNSAPSSVPTTTSSTATSSPMPNDDQKNFQAVSSNRGATDMENAIAIVSVQPVQKPTRNRRSAPVPPDDSPPALKSSGFDASLQSTNHSKPAEGSAKLAETDNRQLVGGFQESSVTMNGFSGNGMGGKDDDDDGVEISLDVADVEYVQPVRPKLRQGESARKPLTPVFGSGSLTRQTNGSSQARKNHDDDSMPGNSKLGDISTASVVFQKKSLPENVDDVQSSDSETENPETNAEDENEQQEAEIIVDESITALQKSVGLYTYSYSAGDVLPPPKPTSKSSEKFDFKSSAGNKGIEFVQKQKADGTTERSKSRPAAVSSDSSTLKEERVRMTNVHSAQWNGKEEVQDVEEMDESAIALQKSVGLYTYSYSAGDTATSQPTKNSSSKSHADGRYGSAGSAMASSKRPGQSYGHREMGEEVVEVRAADRNGKRDLQKDRVSISHEVHRSPSESPTVEVGQTARGDQLDDKFELTAGRVQYSDAHSAGRKDLPVTERLNGAWKDEQECELSAGRSSSVAQAKVNSSPGPRGRESRFGSDIPQENEFEMTAGRSSASVSVVETVSAPVVRQTAAAKDKEVELSANRQRTTEKELQRPPKVDDGNRDMKIQDDTSEVSSRIQLRSGKVDIGVFDDGSSSTELGKQNKTVQKTSSNDGVDTLFDRMGGLHVTNDDELTSADKDDATGSSSRPIKSDGDNSMWEEIQSEMDLRMAKERDLAVDAGSFRLNDSASEKVNEKGVFSSGQNSNVVIKRASRDSTFTSLSDDGSSQALKPESPYGSHLVYRSQQESTESVSTGLQVSNASTKSAEGQQPKMQVYNSLRDARRGKATSWQPETIVIDKPNIYTMFGGARKQDETTKSDLTAVAKTSEGRVYTSAAVVQNQPEENKTKPAESVKRDEVKVAESVTVVSVNIPDYEQKADVKSRPKYSRHSLYYEPGSLGSAESDKKKESSPVVKSPPSSCSPQESVAEKKLQEYQDAKTTMIKIVNGNAVIGGSVPSKPASTPQGAASSRMDQYIRGSPEDDMAVKNVEKPLKTAYTTRVTVTASEDPKIYPDIGKGSRKDADSKHSAKFDVDDAADMATVKDGASLKLESTGKFSSSVSSETSGKVTHSPPKASTNTLPSAKDPTETEKLSVQSSISEATAAKPVTSSQSDSSRNHNSEMQPKQNIESSAVAREPRVMLRSGNRVSDAMRIFDSGNGSSSAVTNSGLRREEGGAQQFVAAASAVRYGASRDRPKSTILDGHQVAEAAAKDERKASTSAAEVAYKDSSINRKDTASAANSRSHGTNGDQNGNSTAEQRRPNLTETTSGKSDIHNSANVSHRNATAKGSTLAVADKDVRKSNVDEKIVSVRHAEAAKQPSPQTSENVSRNGARSTLNASSISKQMESGAKNDLAVGSAVRYSPKRDSVPDGKKDKQAPVSAAAVASNHRTPNASQKETGNVGSAHAVNESKSVRDGKEFKKTYGAEERSAAKPAEVTVKQSSAVRRTTSTPGSSSMLLSAAGAAPDTKPEFISVQLRPVQKKATDDTKTSTEPTAGSSSDYKPSHNAVTTSEPRENRNTAGNVQKQIDSPSSVLDGKVKPDKQPNENRTAVASAVASNPPAVSKMLLNSAQPVETRSNDNTDLPPSRYALRRSTTAPVATNPGLNLSPTDPEQKKPESPTANRTSMFGVTLKSRTASDNQKSGQANISPVSPVELMSPRAPASASKIEKTEVKSVTSSMLAQSTAQVKSSKTETRGVTASKIDVAENRNAPGSSVVHSHSAALLTSSLSRTGKGTNASASSSSESEKKPVAMGTQLETVNLRRAATTSDVKSVAPSASKPEDLELKPAVVLQPARARPPAKNLPPPKLTLHEQLMNAIRGAGGSVTAVADGKPSESRQSPGMGDSTNGKSLESAISGTEAAASKASTVTSPADNASSQSGPPKLNSVTAARTTRSKRVIEAPKLTPREELMAAIRNASGSASRKSTSVSTESDESPVERCSAKLVDENWTSKSVIRLASSSSAGSAVSPLSPPVRAAASVPAVNGGPAPPPPPLPPTLPVTSEPPKKMAPTGRNVGPPKPDPREELLAAIRNAAGGKTLRKTSSSDGH